MSELCIIYQHPFCFLQKFKIGEDANVTKVAVTNCGTANYARRVRYTILAIECEQFYRSLFFSRVIFYYYFYGSESEWSTMGNKRPIKRQENIDRKLVTLSFLLLSLNLYFFSMTFWFIFIVQERRIECRQLVELTSKTILKLKSNPIKIYIVKQSVVPLVLKDNEN